MALITMSKKELGRLETLVDLDEGRITAVQAAGLIGVGERQVFRLLKAYRTRGAEGLVSRRRGRPGNRRYRDEVREAALTRIRECYADFGPTLAAEKLAELHELRLGRETVRRWMAAAGLWVPRKSACAASINRGTAGIAWASWSRSTAASITGSRTESRLAPCWCSWTTQPAG